jgi:hypothetical protein
VRKLIAIMICSEKGFPGDLGEQGEIGFPGDTAVGPKGQKGEIGEPGDLGLPGNDYSLQPPMEMVDIGPEGRRGDKGDRGDKGIGGLPGLDGLPGQQGMSGAKGEKGELGLLGDRVRIKLISDCFLYNVINFIYFYIGKTRKSRIGWLHWR